MQGVSKVNYTIKTKRLLLRPLNISDLEAVHKYSSDEDNTKYMIFLPNKSIENTSSFLLKVTEEWKKDKLMFYEFAIMLDDTLLGATAIYLSKENNKVGEIGWILDKRYWGNHYATEAALAMVDFAKNILKLDKLYAHCDYRNIASATVMKNIGMKLADDTGTRQYPGSDEIIKELMFTIDFNV